VKTTTQALATALGVDYATTNSLLRALTVLGLVQAIGFDKLEGSKGKGKTIYEINIGIGVQLDVLLAAALAKTA